MRVRPIVRCERKFVRESINANISFSKDAASEANLTRIRREFIRAMTCQRTGSAIRARNEEETQPRNQKNT